MNIFARPEKVAVASLLKACDLPTEDLDQQNFEHFFGFLSNHSLVGAVGLEPYGEVALLRSLAVSPSMRGKGCGKALIQRAQARARQSGITQLFLLTSTAKPFFEGLGFQTTPRETAPPAIRATREFASICPDSATFIVKRLQP